MTKMIFIDVVNHEVKLVEVGKDTFLDDCYKLIGCRLIDIVSRKIGGTYYDIIVDDEGLLKDDPTPSAIDEDGNSMLYGNLLICNTDGEGNEVSLTRDDVENIQSNLYSIDLADPETGEIVRTLAPVVQAEY